MEITDPKNKEKKTPPGTDTTKREFPSAEEQPQEKRVGAGEVAKDDFVKYNEKTKKVEIK